MKNDPHEQDIEKTRAKIWADIQTYGFSALGVIGDQGTPHFTYTIGLFPNIMAELIIFGLRPDQATHVFHLIVNRRKAGTVFSSGQMYEEIAQDYPLFFHQVDRDPLAPGHTRVSALSGRLAGPRQAVPLATWFRGTVQSRPISALPPGCPRGMRYPLSQVIHLS